ncbi:MAG: ABC-2 family transporter protein, partial [bacterium]|nr:ABC-2 family transporter protein [bacterium]
MTAAALVKRKTGKYLKVFTINLKNRMVYFHDLVFSSVFMALIIFIFLRLWQSVFSAGNREAICGFSLADMIWYMVITEAVVLSLPPANQELDEQVKSGQIACYLVRPMNLILYHFSYYLSKVVLKLPVNFLVGVILALVFVGPIGLPAHPVNLLLILFLAVSLDFIIKMNIGILSFWIEETAPVYWIYQKLVFTLGGLMIPLDVFPDWLKTWCLKLPF